MDVSLPYTSVAECIKAEVAKDIAPDQPEVFVKCADLDCTNETRIAWIWQSNIFLVEEGRLLVKPITLWFPLCKAHAPLQEEETFDAVTSDLPEQR